MRLSLVTALIATVAISASAQQKMERPGITNFTKVDAVVACGGATTTAALPALKADGFKAVINLRMANESGANIEENRAKATEVGLKYIHLPMSGSAPEDKTADEFLAAVADTSNQPVYIHCGSANRVGALWLIKRVMQDGWTVDKATAEAKLIGLSSPALQQFAVKYVEARRK